MTGPAPFVEEVKRFQEWALAPASGGSAIVQRALLRITSLYHAALLLPELDEGLPESLQPRVSEGEWREVFVAAGALPFQYYSEVFNPLPVPPEEPVVGDLADDIADIYRDVVGGLRLHEARHFQEAIWHWKFSFIYHWGEHATSAIRVLHCYLSEGETMEAWSGNDE